MLERRKRTRTVRGDGGATAVEYALLVALVALVAISGLTFLRNSSTDSFQTTLANEDGVTVCADGDPNCSAFNALPAANIPGVPVVTTLAATAVGATGATLNGTVNANGTSTAITFCIGTAPDLAGCTVVNGSPTTATGSTATAASAVRTGLATGTTYYYRVIGTSTKGTRYGATLSFVTGSAGSSAPTATSVAATGVTGTAATLNGFVVPGGASTNVTFCYGTQRNLNSCTSASAVPATVTGTTGTAVSLPLTGLQSNRQYYFRVAASNGLGSDTGSILSFTTGAAVTPPVAVTAAANPVGSTTATFRGTVSGNRDDDGTLTFCYGSSAALADACTFTVSAGTYRKNDSNEAVSANVTGLSPAVTYYVRLIATNDGNGVQGLGDLVTLTTGQATQTITFTAPATPQQITGTATLSASASSGLTVTFGTTTSTICSVSATTVTYLAAGTCTITANQAGSTAYAAAPQVTQNVTVTKRSQTITFAQPTSPRPVNATAAVSASATSGLTVTISASPSATCTIASGTVTYRAEGLCTLTATQAGDTTWDAAASVQRDVTVGRPICAALTVTTAQVAKNGTRTVNIFSLNGLSGYSVVGTPTASGDTGTWSLPSTGILTWTPPNGANKTISVSFSYESPTCRQGTATFIVTTT